MVARLPDSSVPRPRYRAASVARRRSRRRCVHPGAGRAARHGHHPAARRVQDPRGHRVWGGDRAEAHGGGGRSRSRRGGIRHGAQSRPLAARPKAPLANPAHPATPGRPRPQGSTRAKRADSVWCATPCTMLRIAQVGQAGGRRAGGGWAAPQLSPGLAAAVPPLTAARARGAGGRGGPDGAVPAAAGDARAAQQGEEPAVTGGGWVAQLGACVYVGGGKGEWGLETWGQRMAVRRSAFSFSPPLALLPQERRGCSGSSRRPEHRRPAALGAARWPARLCRGAAHAGPRFGQPPHAPKWCRARQGEGAGGRERARVGVRRWGSSPRSSHPCFCRCRPCPESPIPSPGPAHPGPRGGGAPPGACAARHCPRQQQRRRGRPAAAAARGAQPSQHARARTERSERPAPLLPRPRRPRGRVGRRARQLGEPHCVQSRT
jgi:hypothetical protein